MLFETRAGPMRLRWNGHGLTAIEMPELSMREVRAELKKQDGAGAPGFVADAARLLKRHLAGEAQDLSALPLDLSVLAPFQRAVYDKVRALRPGRTATYGEIAALLGKPGAARAVGQALGKNPFLVVIPCHRVLAAGGAPGGFSAPGGVIAKQRLLALEGITLAVDHVFLLLVQLDTDAGLRGLGFAWAIHGGGRAMLAVAEDEGGAAAVGPFVRELGLTFPVLLDPDGTLAPRFGVTGYPETFIINRNGQVVNHTIGPAEWDSEQMIAYFEQLLAAPEVQQASR